MDLALTHGYFLSEDRHEQKIMRPYAPLGILSLSAYLKRKGFSVGVFDTTFSSPAEFLGYLRRNQPPIVGIYCNLMTKQRVLWMIEECRKQNCKIVLGGPEPAPYAEDFLKAGADVVVLGEGEETLEELIPALSDQNTATLNSIQGIAYLDEHGFLVTTPPRAFIRDLNSLPWPDREAIDINAYMNAWRRFHGSASISLVTARGCPYTCSWCSHAVYGHSHRRRTPANVVDEIMTLRERYNPDFLWIADDVFTISHSWIFQFRDLMVERGISIPFECISRADRLSEEILDALKTLQCQRIWLGSESGSNRILREMSRGVEVETIRAMTREAQKRGIDVGLFVMLGYDGETEEDIVETIDHLKQTGADTFLTTVAYPIKGTPFFAKVENVIQQPGAWRDFSDRDLKIKGRKSDLYYWFAQRRMTNEVRYHQINESTSRVLDALRYRSKATLARLGMKLTSRIKS